MGIGEILGLVSFAFMLIGGFMKLHQKIEMNRMNNEINKQAIKLLSENYTKIETKVETISNTLIRLETLFEAITQGINDIKKKQSEYDTNIKNFYEKYDLPTK